MIAAVLACIAFGVSLFLKDVPLKQTTHTSDIGDSFAMLRSSTSIAEVERIVRDMASRQRRSLWYQTLAIDLHINLRPDEIWLLGRMAGQHQTSSRDAMSSAHHKDPQAIHHALQTLADSGYIHDNGDEPPRLTDTGQELHRRIVAYGRQKLEDFASTWAPEQHAELNELLNRLALMFVSEPPTR